MTNYYAGIGSRSTPPEILSLMTKTAEHLRSMEFTLRSGHAPGADQAFERGAGEDCNIFLPWDGFEREVPIIGRRFCPPTVAAMQLAERYHPKWQYMSHAAQLLHARNSHQVMGKRLNLPVDFVICWTPDGKRGGGTGQALRIAEAQKIDIYDLAIPVDYEYVRSWIEE